MPREILPTQVKPTHYDLIIEPDLDKLAFSATETVYLNIKKPTNVVILNCKDLIVDPKSVKLTGHKLKNITYDVELQRVSFVFDKEIQITNSAMLSFYFTGVINDDMTGIYRTKYTNSSGKEVYAVATQFEATDARRAFVCADEPGLKATFKVVLVIPKELTGLSNMPEIRKVPLDTDDNKVIITFDKTPVMSTYLLAFYVGEVEYVEAISTKTHNKKPTVYRVYTQPGQKEEGRFALEVSVKVTKLYEDFFGTDYPLPKMDLIAIPDFGSGAMENWGFITFRPKYLLYNKNTTSAKLKIIQAVVICHEIAHQWFGNLVTMDWWTGLWLNEGFATWMEWYSVDKLYPEWKVWDMFNSEDLQSALELDELDNSHPVISSVDKATEVDEIFDSITYQKGAAVIVMLVKYLGEDAFRTGIQNYMKKYQYANATTEQLWECLSEASKKDVSGMMASWTEQTGYPIVEVDITNNGTTVHVKQKKYRADVTTGVDVIDPLWVIPLNILVSDGKVLNNTELSTKESVVTLDANTTTKCIKINAGQTGFYRAQYVSKESLDTLCTNIKNKTLPPIDRAEIISNMFSFARSGHSDTNTVINFLESCYLNNKQLAPENEYIVWNAINTGISHIRTVWYKNLEVKDKLKSVLLPISQSIFKKYGWDENKDTNETYQDVQLRILLISLLGYYNDTATLSEAQKRFDKWISNPNDDSELRSDIRYNVISMMVKNNRTNFKNLLNSYDKIQSNIVQTEIIRAIGATNNPEDLQTALDFCYKSNKVRKQDVIAVSATAGSGQLRELHWKYITNNWEHISAMFKGSTRLLGYLISYSVEYLYDRELYDSAVEFLDTKKEELTEYQKTVKQSLEVTATGLKWFDRDNAQVSAWASPSSSTTSKAAY